MPKRTKRAPKELKSTLAFNHVMVYARNVQRAMYFYRDLLGFKLLELFEGQGMPCYARLRSPAGRTTIALHEFESGVNPPDREGIRLYFEVKELDRLCKKLVGEGVEIQQMPKRMPWGWKHAYLKDPDGHELSLYWAGQKRLKKSRPE